MVIDGVNFPLLDNPATLAEFKRGVSESFIGRLEVEEEVMQFENYDMGEDVPDGLKFFIEKLEEVRAGIPEQYRESARIYLDSSYDSCIATMKVVYSRPETDAEMKKRIDTHVTYALQRLYEEQRMFNHLKEKYGG